MYFLDLDLRCGDEWFVREWVGVSALVLRALHVQVLPEYVGELVHQVRHHVAARGDTHELQVLQHSQVIVARSRIFD